MENRPLLLRMMAIAVAYYVAGRLGLELAVPPGYATAIWPPSGIALAAVLLYGPGIWPGIAIGSFLINVWTGFDASTPSGLAQSLGVPAVIGCGAALQAVVGSILVKRFVTFPNGFVEVGPVVRLLLFGGVVACLINSTIGVAVLCTTGRLLRANGPFTWATWWGGDTVGVFVFTPLVISWLAPPRQQWQQRWLPITVSLGISFVLTVALVSYTALLERRNFASEFSDRTRPLAAEVEKAVAVYLGAVGSVEGFLARTPTRSRAEFALFGSRVRAHVPGIQALEWAPRVPLAHRDAFEAVARSEGLADFEIRERDDGKLVRATDRADFFPVTYVEPVAGNVEAIGFDLASHAGRRAALEAARDSGQPSLSERITLVQGGENADGFLAFAAIYQSAKPQDTVEQRRQALDGFALAVVRFADLIKFAFRGHDLEGTDFWLLDETIPSQPTVLATNSIGAPSMFHLTDRGLFGATTVLGYRSSLGIGGRRWVFQAAPTQAFIARFRLQSSWTVLLLGLLVTGLVGAFVMVLTGREAVLRLLFDNNPQPMWAFDRETLRFVEVNNAAVAKYGYSRAEFADMRITDLRPPEDVPRLMEHLATRGPGYDQPSDWRHRLHDGRIIDVEISAHEIELSARRVRLVSAHDVTDRKKAQQAVLESEQVARGIIDTALDAFVQMDEAGNIVEWNRQAEATFGWSRQEVIGKSLEEMIVPPAHRLRHRAGLVRYLRTGESKLLGTLFEITALRRDGQEFKVEVAVTGLRRQSGYVFNGFIRDITARIAAEEEHRQAQKMEAVGKLTGGVAHDFNNILTVIAGSIEVLADAVAGQPKLAAAAKMIDQAAERGTELTRHLLAFARKQPLQPRETDVNALIVETARLLRPSLGEQVEIESIFAEDAWPALVDPSQLAMALLNLAINSRDAMPQGGRLTVETANADFDEAYARANDVQPGSYVMIAVRDSGLGIPAAIRDKVFEPFFTTKGAGEGTGLGLSMVYGFIKQSGGHVTLNSEEGHGTTIKLYLPRASARPTRPSTVPAAERLEGGDETILLVEDDALVRACVGAQLESLGYTALSATTAAETLALVDKGAKFDLLLTDVIMPGSMNGRELAEEVVRRRPMTKVLYTSGYTQDAILHHGRLDPGVLLLAKPYRKAELARLVRTALDG